MEFIFQIAILIMSVVVHEVAHGYAALSLGDSTARYEGRLTLNPVKHLDPLGSFIIPMISFLFGGVLLGWAKPVPYNPYNLRPGRFSEALVAVAGPLANFSLALFFGLLVRLGGGVLSPQFIQISLAIVLINSVLGVFNLVPIPPLDGSKILFALLPQKAYAWRSLYEQYGFFILLLFIFFFANLIYPLVSVLFKVFTGLAL